MLAVLPLRLRPKENEAAEVMELIELRRCNPFSGPNRVGSSNADLSVNPGFPARGSGMTISMTRSLGGILAGVTLPASLPTRDLGREDKLATEWECPNAPSSSKGSGVVNGNAFAGNSRRCSTTNVCDNERCRRRLCH
jgi:hypothetical protein